MKISYNWMQQFIQAELPLEQQLDLLTDLGLEVEGNEVFESVPGSLAGVVVGEVLSCEQHPNADRLRVTRVNIGQEEAVQIVCGAPNVAAGQKVPVATVGTTLYDKDGKAWEIKKSKIRGEASFGMICAEDELGLGNAHDGIMVLDPALEPGTPCAEIFPVEKDQTIEIGLTPNRCDAMSHMGVARDLKAGCIQRNIPYTWNFPNTNAFRVDNTSLPIDIIVEEPKLAPQYSGITLDNLTVKDSPSWLQNRLKAIGLSPINNVVDVTNYILHELGQPLHAFDADKIKGKVMVKTLPQDTPFTTLDGVTRKLHEEDLMICDEEKPLCIAGVFGGLDSGVTKNTKRLFLECAYFDAVSIRKTAKRHGLNTDASFRYERGIDPEIGEFAIKRAVLLIQELAGGDITSDLLSIKQPLADKVSLFIQYDKITRVLGQEIPKDELIKILNALEIEIINATEEGFSMHIPRYRVDVTREADVIEEILRIYGYNNIQSVNSMKTFYPDFNLKTAHVLEQNIAKKFVGMGFQEIINNSITSPKYATFSKELDAIAKVDLLNPLGQELSQLRSSMLFSTLEVIAYNQNRQRKALSIYEFGKVYSREEDGFKEKKKIALALCGRAQKEAWNTEDATNDIYRLKGSLYALLESLGLDAFTEESSDRDIFEYSQCISARKKQVVYYGSVAKSILNQFSIDQEVVYAEIDFATLYQLAFKKELIVAPIPKFPSSRRDFALLVDQGVSFDALKQVAQKVDRKILTEINLFDVYEGKNLPAGKKSYGMSFLFSDPHKTLTDKHIDKVMQKLQSSFEKEFGASLR
ncbi:MAG: phenylalanine--tRNA ligase subunit beta [Flavobacteriaceae bacterium]